MFEKCSQCARRHSFECPHLSTPKQADKDLLDQHKAPLCSRFKQAPPTPPRMTKDEFAAKQTELLKDIPKQFHGALSYLAWEDGHSSGYENVLNCLQNLIDELLSPIIAYGKAVAEETQHSLQVDRKTT